MPDFATAAQVAVAALVAQLSPQAIVWFGSTVAGRGGPDSDLDLLIVAPREAGTRKDLLHRARAAIWDLPVPVDLLVYFPDEVAERRERLGSVVREAFRNGRVVYGRV